MLRWRILAAMFATLVSGTGACAQVVIVGPEQYEEFGPEATIAIVGTAPDERTPMSVRLKRYGSRVIHNSHGFYAAGAFSAELRPPQNGRWEPGQSVLEIMNGAKLEAIVAITVVEDEEENPFVAGRLALVDKQEWKAKPQEEIKVDGSFRSKQPQPAPFRLS